MGKVVKIAAVAVGVAALFVPGVGTAISGFIGSALTSAAGVYATSSFAIGQALTMGLIATGVSSAVAFGAKALGLGPKPPKQSPASADRLSAGLDPRAYRKIVFGHTAAAIDMRYQEFTGADQEYLNSILAHASHELHAIEEIWFDDKKAWSAGGGVTADFAGYLSVAEVKAGSPGTAFTITGSSSWTVGASRFVGCAYTWLRYKLTGNTKKAESPFASGVTGRITVRVKGALLYDPRRDSTVPGGSGSHRANDQTTWAWVSDDVGRNPALQLLWYLLGWRIQNADTGQWMLAVGLGLPVARIDLPSFIAAANLCDEPVALAAGGTEPRYRSDGVFSEGDDPSLVFENLLAAMNGVLRDAGGKLVLDVLHNDLGSPVLDLSADDVIGEFTWLQTPPIDQYFNVVRGQYVDASDEGLYQMADYPDVALAAPDGIERPQPFNLPMVQSASQAQRLVKQYLQRAQYPGTFTATFLASAWQCQVGSVIRLTFPALGFSNKLFRVAEHSIRFDGTCPMVLREEAAAIYAWDKEESPAVVAAAPTPYDPLNEPWVQALGGIDLDALENFINDNDGNGLTPPAATSISLSSTMALDGSAALTAGWSYTTSSDPAAANNIDGFLVGFYPQATSASWTYTGSGSTAMEWRVVESHIRTLTILGQPVEKYYWIVVIPYRRVRTDVDASGVITGAPAQTAAGSGHRPAATPNYLGSVNGYLASYISSAAYNVTNDNDGNASMPPAATGLSLSSLLYPDSTAGITLSWSYTNSTTPGAANNIDGFLVGLYGKASGASWTYTGSALDNLLEWRWVEAHVRSTNYGKTVANYYWGVVIPVRRVRADIAVGGYIPGPAAQTTAGSGHRPALSPNFTGGIDSMSASLVAIGSNRAYGSIRGDGTMEDDTVRAASIVAGAINETDYASQGALIALTPSLVYRNIMIAGVVVGASGRLICRFVPSWYLEKFSPVQGATYSLDFEIALLQSSTVRYTSDKYTVSERWDSPSTGTTVTMERRVGVLEHYFSGVTPGTYDVYFQATTPATNSAYLPPYRYMNARVPRADE